MPFNVTMSLAVSSSWRRLYERCQAYWSVPTGETISHDHQERLTEPQEGKPITFILQETVGIPFDAPAAPSKLIVDPSAHSSSPEDWPIDLRSLVAQHKLGIHRGIAALMSSLPMRGHAYSGPTRAASLPIVHGKVLVGFVLVFLSGALPVDEHMLIFLDLLSRQISTSASMVASYEHEVAKLEEMAAIDHAKTAFFTNISHELRTPLTLILGPVSELLNGSASTGSGGALPSGARTQLDIVERNAKRLLRLVNTIMDFATAEAGRTTSTFTPTALGEYTADLASAFRSAAGLADLVYIVDIAKIPNGLLVYVDRDKWEKIVYNLLSNAIKYTLAGSVHVRAYVDTTGKANASAEADLSLGQDRFVLEVEDTGVGIPSGELGSVFDKFHRARTAQGRSIEGTGIGLAYTLELVKAHRGVVTVESTPGKGSKFRVHLLLGKAHLPPGSVVEKDHVAEWVMTPPLSDPSVVDGLAVGRYMDELVQMLPPSETETSSESQTFSSDVLWQPLIFGDRERARILVADDNAVGVLDFSYS
jgi:signal transduction histidine kinase